jgi:uncharacterized OsmC-like protein
MMTVLHTAAVTGPVGETEKITVRHLNRDRYEVHVRGHRTVVDQPLIDGGEDTAPTPTELFIASLAGCVAFYAGRYLQRHGLPIAGLEVHVRYEMASRPARVGRIWVEITPPEGLPDDRRERLLAVASHCTIHNSLVSPPSVAVTLTG